MMSLDSSPVSVAIQFSLPCPPPLPGLSSIVDTEEKCNCFYSLVGSSLDMNDPSTWDDYFTDDTVQNFPQTGQYFGVDGIAEYLSYVKDGVFVKDYIQLYDTLPLDMTGTNATQCVFLQSERRRFPFNSEYTKDNVDMCVDVVAGTSLQYVLTGNPSAPIRIDVINVWLPNELISETFPMQDTDATAEFVCNAIVNSCNRSATGPDDDAADDNGLVPDDIETCLDTYGSLKNYDEDLESGISYIDGNTKGCRILHSFYATTNKVHCPHISFEPEVDVNGYVKCNKSKGTLPSDLFTESQLQMIVGSSELLGFEPFTPFQMSLDGCPATESPTESPNDDEKLPGQCSDTPVTIGPPPDGDICEPDCQCIPDTEPFCDTCPPFEDRTILATEKAAKESEFFAKLNLDDEESLYTFYPPGCQPFPLVAQTLFQGTVPTCEGVIQKRKLINGKELSVTPEVLFRNDDDALLQCSFKYEENVCTAKQYHVVEEKIQVGRRLGEYIRIAGGPDSFLLGSGNLMTTAACTNDPFFKFVYINKRGVAKEKGGCDDFVDKKKKKRCGKTMINGDKVRDKCPITCGKPLCTCEDKKDWFKVNINGKKERKNCYKNIDPDVDCSIPKVMDSCPVKCQVSDCVDDDDKYKVGTFVTHDGHCGVCSSAQDLAVIYSPTLDQESYNCTSSVREALASQDPSKIGQAFLDLQTCYESIGFTPDCSKIWSSNSLNTLLTLGSVLLGGGDPSSLPKSCIDCAQQCLLNPDTPECNTQMKPSSCELSACFLCDDAVSEPTFGFYAGRTRRSSGIYSVFQPSAGMPLYVGTKRPCSEVPNIGQPRPECS